MQKKKSKEVDMLDFPYHKAKRKFPKMKLSIQEHYKRRPVVPAWTFEAICRELEKKEPLAVVLLRMSDLHGVNPEFAAKHEPYWDASKYDVDSFTDHIIRTAARADRQALNAVSDHVKEINERRGYSDRPVYVEPEEKEERQLAPKKEVKFKHQNLFGHPISYVLRRMGKEDFDFDTAKKAIESFGIFVKDSTIKGQLWCGTKKSKKYSGKMADLSEKQIDQLWIAGSK